MSATDAEERNTGAGGTTGDESGPTTGAGGSTGNEETGAAFDAPVASSAAPGSAGSEKESEDTGAGFDAPATGLG